MQTFIFFAVLTLNLSKATFVPGQAFNRLITIWIGNHDLEIFSNEDNVLRTLYERGNLLRNYWGVSHPSQPNYIASIAGDYFGLDHDNRVALPRNVSTVVDLLDAKAIGWKAYIQSSPQGPESGSTSSEPDGAWKHNPFQSFESILLNETRMAQVVDLAQLGDDIASRTLPQLVYISYNIQRDQPDPSSKQLARWVNDALMPLLDDDYVVNSTLILLTSAENSSYTAPNKVATLLLGDVVPVDQRGTFDPRYYSPYSILSTIQNNWALPCLGRYDVGANVFELVTHNTGYKNHMPSNMKTIENSVPYPGFLSSDKDEFLPIPTPNMELIGAGRLGIDGTTKEFWGTHRLELTPYGGTNRANDGSAIEANAVVYQAQTTAPAKYAVKPKFEWTKWCQAFTFRNT